MSRYRCLALLFAVLLLGQLGCGNSAQPAPAPQPEASAPTPAPAAQPEPAPAAPAAEPAGQPEPAPAAPAAEPAAEAAAPAAFPVTTAKPGEPPVPKGFKNQAEVLLAVGTGQVKAIKGNPPIPDTIAEVKDVEYCNVDGKSLKLDLYYKKDLAQPAPLLLFIHGGGWSGGERGIYKAYCVPFAEKGYVTATTSYRLSGIAKFPAAVQDVKCAVKFLRANAAQYHIDPDKIAAIGGSAGGHLSMMIGYSPDVPELEPTVGPQGVSDKIQAVVNFYGPCDMTTDFAKKRSEPKSFLGKTYDEAPDLYKQASPITFLTPDDPPTLIFHGTIDDTVPVEQSDELAAKLQELKIPFVYEKYEGWPHTMDLAQDVYNRATWAMDQFLAKYLPLPGQQPPAAP